MKKVNEQHAEADIEGDRNFQSRISRLHQLGILGEKVAESKADSCYIENWGGFKSRWLQFCELDYVAGYTALLSRDETFTRLQTLHKEAPPFICIAGFEMDAVSLNSSDTFQQTPFPKMNVVFQISQVAPDILEPVNQGTPNSTTHLLLAQSSKASIWFGSPISTGTIGRTLGVYLERSGPARLSQGARLFKQTNQPDHAAPPNAADAEPAHPAESSRNRSATTPSPSSFPEVKPSSASV